MIYFRFLVDANFSLAGGRHQILKALKVSVRAYTAEEAKRLVPEETLNCLRGPGSPIGEFVDAEITNIRYR